MHYIFVILLILSLPLKSQNLVRNPSFEKHERIPCSKGTGVEQGKMQQYVYDWSIPVYGSPNVYHQEGLKICPETYRQHKTILVPKDGKMMIGVYAHKDNWGELIQTKLKRPLLPSKMYYVSFWIRQRNKSYLSNNVGIYFSGKKIHITNPLTPFFKTPHVTIDSVVQHYDWVQISDTVLVDAPKAYLILGGFKPKGTQIYQASSTTISSGSTIGTYYYIDDIKVIDITPKSDTDDDSFESIPFKVNSSSITKVAELEKLVKFLNNNTTYIIRLTGYSDTTGDTKSNFELAQKRVREVKEFLLKKGIHPNRIYTRTHGETATENARKVTIELKDRYSK